MDCQFCNVERATHFRVPTRYGVATTAHGVQVQAAPVIQGGDFADRLSVGPTGKWRQAPAAGESGVAGEGTRPRNVDAIVRTPGTRCGSENTASCSR